MKKILLCTTALVGFASLASAADMSSNGDMQVSVGGNSKFEAGYVKRDRDHKKSFTFSPNQSSSAFMTSNKAAIKAEGKNDSMTYGAVIRLQTVANLSSGMSDSGLDRSHIFMNTDAGAVQMGTNFAASKLLSVDAGTIASATGGAAGGDYSKFIDVRENTVFGSAPVFDADTLSNRLDGYGESARKITYLSPRISGAQLGMSFAPDIENNGGQGYSRDNGQRYLGRPLAAKNLFSVALNYKNSFDDVNVMFSAAGDFAKANQKSIATGSQNIVTQSDVDADGNPIASTAKNYIVTTVDYDKTTQARNDLKTYSVGTVVEYQGFSAALSYANDGKSLAPKTSDFTAYWYTAGLGYKNGPMSTSLTYLYGKKGNKKAAQGDENSYPLVKTSAVSLGADYAVAPGMTPFAEVTMATVKPKKVINGDTKQRATVFILGSRIKF